MKGNADAETVTLTVVPITTAALSFIASSLIIVMIRRSKKKLKDAYRRIILGMSVFDIFSSLAVALKFFKSYPEADSDMWLPLGNQTSCGILGFLHIIGTVGTPMYSVNLNIYYYYLVKQDMREETFKKKIEPWLHSVTIIWSIVGGVYIWAAGLINPGPIGACFIAAYPLGCAKNDDVECIRGQNQMLATVLYLGVPIVSCLIISITLLIAIWHKVRAQETRMDRYRIRRVSVQMGLSLNENNDNTGGDGILRDASRRVRKWRNRRTTRKRTPSNSRTFVWAAVWYTVAFIATFIFPSIIIVMKIIGSQTPFVVRLFSRLLQPLQGVFNILVYTRPHVKKYRLVNPEWTWFQAFRHVVMSGGDDDRSSNDRSSRSRGTGTLRSSTGSSTRDSRTPREVSMFGPLKRNSSRKNVFDPNTDEESNLCIAGNGRKPVSVANEESSSEVSSLRKDNSRPLITTVNSRFQDGIETENCLRGSLSPSEGEIKQECRDQRNVTILPEESDGAAHDPNMSDAVMGDR